MFPIKRCYDGAMVAPAIARFLYLGPAIATMAGWAWVEDGWELTAEALVVCAFLANAL